MDRIRSTKNGNLSVLTGGLSRREMSPEEWFEREFQAWAARGRVRRNYRSGAYATRALADTAQKLRFPNRIPARVLGEALEQGAPTSWAMELPEIVRQYIARKARSLGRVVDDVRDAA